MFFRESHVQQPATKKMSSLLLQLFFISPFLLSLRLISQDSGVSEINSDTIYAFILIQQLSMVLKPLTKIHREDTLDRIICNFNWEFENLQLYFLKYS